MTRRRPARAAVETHEGLVHEGTAVLRDLGVDLSPPRARAPRPGRRPTPRISEKVEQQQIAGTIRAIGGTVYTVGTRRPAGDHQGTCQTPGLPDLMAFVPDVRARNATLANPEADVPRRAAQLLALFIEVKAEGGRLSDAQVAFQTQCHLAGVGHVVGGLNAVIAWLLKHGVIREHQVPHYRLPAPANRPEAAS